MVKLRVLISMELEGVTNVRPADDDYQYFFTVSCSSCREEHPNTVAFGAKDEVEISGSRGTANFVWRCQNCKKEHSASFIPSPPSKTTAPIPYTTSGQFQPFITLDCRGLEFTKFHFRGKWKCRSDGEETGKKGLESFEFDLDEGDEEGRWDDYDEKAGQAVSVSEMESKIERA